MNPEWIRGVCLRFPAVTEHVIWGNDLTFKIANKMFAHAALDPGLPVWLSFKASPENFYQLTERQDIIPAPYLARAQWVALETRDAVPSAELAALLREAYELVVAKLPAKTRASLAAPAAPAKHHKARKAKAPKPARKQNPAKRRLASKKSTKSNKGTKKVRNS